MGNIEPFARAQQEVLGEDHAYPMLAYGTMKAPAAWKLYAKSQGLPFEIANEVSNQLKRYEMAVKHADEDEKDDISPDDYIEPQYRDVYNKSKEYQSLVVSWSIAPCSYLLYQGSIRKEVGLVMIKDHLCCCMDGHVAEENHFLKNDLLKVAVVDLIYRSYERAGVKVPDVRELLQMCPPEDPAWKLYATGCTMALNQVERTGTSARVKEYKPTNISELCAFVAAIRPGFKSMYKTFAEREPFSYGVKAFDDLIQTEEMPNSFLLYQEQEMAALHYAGIPMDECYTAIKNIAKKRTEKVLVYKDKFIEGIERTVTQDEGRSQEEAEHISHDLWRIIEDSASYSFNCVSGKTRIQRLGDKCSTFWPTIEEMYKIREDSEYAKKTNHIPLRQKYRRYGFGNALSMFNDGRIRKNDIVGIYPSGVQKTYMVTTSTGKSVVCTMNHSFPTPEGKKTLSELSVGDVLYCKGDYEKCTNKYTFTDGEFEKNTPVKGQRGFQTNPDGASVVYLSERDRHVLAKDSCEHCGRPFDNAKRFELHHKDFDRTNNVRENYEWLCVSCHKKAHYQNGRVKVFEKGIPTYLDEIVSIEYQGEEEVYDIEMADPAHNFISESGLVVSNCSHSYCVSIDSLYSAWLKAHYPCQFYEVALAIADEKGDKGRMAELQLEASDYFRIKFEPFRFGQDNRSIVAHPKTNSITNKLTSIKGFGNTVCYQLYECSRTEPQTFMDVLKWLDKKSIKAAKVQPLILIDYFSDFGNVPTLSRILEFFDFFQQGRAKSIKKDKLTPDVEEIVAKYATDKGVKGNELKTWTITDMDGLLREGEERIKALNLPDLPMKVRIQNSLDLLGRIDVQTNKPEDRCLLTVLDIWPLTDRKTGNPWAFRLSVQSIGTGKTASLSVYADRYAKDPISKGSLIRTREGDVKKNNKGYWYLYNWEPAA